MLLKKAWASTFGGGGGQFAAFYRNVELVAKLDYCDWIYAVDEYCNFMITIKMDFPVRKSIHNVVQFLWKPLKNCPR